MSSSPGAAREDQIEHITRVVLAVLEARQTQPEAPKAWHQRLGAFVLGNWTFVVFTLGVATLIGASIVYETSPLHYLKQLAVADRELDAKQRKFDYEAEMARRYIALGDAFLDQGRFADAGDAFKRALALDPYSTEASLGRHKAELFASSRTAQFDPGVIALRITSVLGDASGRIEDAHALAALGQLALTADDLDAAQDHFAAAAARRPQLAEAHNGLGLVAFERQDFQTAAAAFEEAHRIAPHHLDYRTNLASALVYSAASDQTAYDRAIKHYQIIFRSDGEMLLPYLECALAFRLSGDFQRSLKVLAHALPLFDHDEVLALDKNAHDWLLFIGGRQIVLSQATEKRLYAHLGALLSAHLVDDQAAAQRHAAQLAKPAQRWSTLIQNALEAEATDLRARHPAFGQRIDAFQATLRRVANGQLSAERS